MKNYFFLTHYHDETRTDLICIKLLNNLYKITISRMNFREKFFYFTLTSKIFTSKLKRKKFFILKAKIVNKLYKYYACSE